MEKVVSMVNQEFWRGKKVFLTGHTGFKGAWASLWLNNLGAEVFGYALEPATDPNLFEAARLAEVIRHKVGDIRNFKLLSESLRDSQADIVIHMAAQPLVRYSYSHPIETYETNVLGTAYLLEAVRQCPTVKAVVIVTTDKVYENFEREAGYRETEPLGGYDPYSSSKACAEIVTAAMRKSFFNQSSGVKAHPALVATARAGNVIGGGDWALDRLVPDLIRNFHEGKVVNIRSPRSIRPWQHVLEPLSGYFKLAESLILGGEKFANAWNFGPQEDDAKDVEFLVRNIANLWGNDARWLKDPGPHPHEAHFLRLNIEKAEEELNWIPHWNLETTLFETVSWYKKYYQNPDSARKLAIEQIKKYQENQ